MKIAMQKKIKKSGCKFNFPRSIPLEILSLDSLVSETAIFLPAIQRTGDKKAINGLLSSFGIFLFPQLWCQESTVVTQLSEQRVGTVGTG